MNTLLRFKSRHIKSPHTPLIHRMRFHPNGSKSQKINHNHPYHTNLLILWTRFSRGNFTPCCSNRFKDIWGSWKAYWGHLGLIANRSTRLLRKKSNNMKRKLIQSNLIMIFSLLIKTINAYWIYSTILMMKMKKTPP